MKKLLLASTALVLSAGMATAQGVRVTGDARLGVAYDSAASDEFRFVGRARVIFSGSGTTDGGLTFGMSIRADNAVAATAGSAGTSTMTDGSVFISGAFGRLTVGNADGAARFLIGHLHGVGLTGVTGIGGYHEFAYLSNAGSNRPSARYQYAFGDFTFALSADQPGTSDIWSIGARYNFMGFTLGAAYEGDPAGDHWIVGATGSFGDFGFRAAFGERNSANQYGISVSADVGGVSLPGTTINAFYRNDFADVDFYGIGFSYDLGGGASLMGGIARDGGAGRTQADFGISMRF